MRSLSMAVGVLAVGSVVLAAPQAFGKDGVRATLAGPVPLHASAGKVVHVRWTLASTDGHGRSRPFSASGVFVRLLSAKGGGSKTGYASSTSGLYRASVIVPAGGVGAVQIGLVGWSDGPAGRHRADELFPITNNPLQSRCRSVFASASPHFPCRA
jgi:hypothetical protein